MVELAGKPGPSYQIPRRSKKQVYAVGIPTRKSVIPSLLPTQKTMTYKNLAEPGPIDTRRELSVRSEEAARSRHAGQREMEGPER